MNNAAQRRAIEKTYSDTCNIFTLESTVEKSITVMKRKIAHENVKCALSQKNLKQSEQTKIENSVVQEAKIFLAPEIIVEPGSRIEVNRMGRPTVYECSGQPFVYETHQEIVVKLSTKA